MGNKQTAAPFAAPADGLGYTTGRLANDPYAAERARQAAEQSGRNQAKAAQVQADADRFWAKDPTHHPRYMEALVAGASMAELDRIEAEIRFNRDNRLEG